MDVDEELEEGEILQNSVDNDAPMPDAGTTQPAPTADNTHNTSGATVSTSPDNPVSTGNPSDRSVSPQQPAAAATAVSTQPVRPEQTEQPALITTVIKAGMQTLWRDPRAPPPAPAKKTGTQKPAQPKGNPSTKKDGRRTQQSNSRASPNNKRATNGAKSGKGTDQASSTSNSSPSYAAVVAGSALSGGARRVRQHTDDRVRQAIVVPVASYEKKRKTPDSAAPATTPAPPASKKGPYQQLSTRKDTAPASTNPFAPLAETSGQATHPTTASVATNASGHAPTAGLAGELANTPEGFVHQDGSITPHQGSGWDGADESSYE
jgi:hypothetical protein